MGFVVGPETPILLPTLAGSGHAMRMVRPLGNPLFLPDLACRLDDGETDLKGFQRAGLERS